MSSTFVFLYRTLSLFTAVSLYCSLSLLQSLFTAVSLSKIGRYTFTLYTSENGEAGQSSQVRESHYLRRTGHHIAQHMIHMLSHLNAEEQKEGPGFVGLTIFSKQDIILHNVTVLVPWYHLALPFFSSGMRLFCCLVEIQCVAVCCSVMQCVAVCCSVLQCVAVCCSVTFLVPRNSLALPFIPSVMQLFCCLAEIQCVAVRCSVLQCVAVCCSVQPGRNSACSSRVLQCVVVRHRVLQCVATSCSVLQRHCSRSTKLSCAAPCPNWNAALLLPLLQCVANKVCCSVLQCVTVCYSALQCAAVWRMDVQCVAACCNRFPIGMRLCCLQCAVCCSVLQCVAMWCNALQCAAVCCSMLHCVAGWHGALQCVAINSPLACSCAACSVLLCCGVLQRVAW